jgi:hypothetical protein
MFPELENSQEKTLKEINGLRQSLRRKFALGMRERAREILEGCGI